MILCIITHLLVCHLLADFLEAIKKDFKKARKIYKTNCEDHNFAKSCYKYGNYVALGKGGGKSDLASALPYFDRACKGNEYPACFQQGLILISDLSKHGIQKDVKKGAELIEKACDGKFDLACYHAFGIYIEGLKKSGADVAAGQVEYEVRGDKEKAFRYAKEGCDLGNIYCCANLSQMYKKGDGTYLFGQKVQFLIVVLQV